MSADHDREMRRLAHIAEDSWYGKGLNADSVRYSAAVFARHWRGSSCLDLGPAEGHMTAVLAGRFPDLTLVEGSERFCAELRDRFPSACVVSSLFETFRPSRRWDTIVLGHVLEHVADPRGLLRRVAEWLAPGGVVCAAVPNARSFHRQAGVILGLLPDEHALTEADHHHGHRRVYDPESFSAEFAAAGLRVLVQGGYWLKPLSNAQIEASWSPEMVAAFMQLGERYPDTAAEIYVVAAV